MAMNRAGGAVGRSLKVAALASLAPALMMGALSSRPSAAQMDGKVTFHNDITPILQRSCQGCHRPDSVAPMSLISYEEVRPWAKAIKDRTGRGNRMGVMPPWFIDQNVGIQAYKDDISLSGTE